VPTSSASTRWNGEGPGSHGVVARPCGEGARRRTVMERLRPAVADSVGRSCGHGWLGFVMREKGRGGSREVRRGLGIEGESGSWRRELVREAPG
jgi:hypothetical protein